MVLIFLCRKCKDILLQDEVSSIWNLLAQALLFLVPKVYSASGLAQC